MHNEKDGSICKFVSTSCHLQAGIDISTWWKQARKWIPTNISPLCKDKNTTIKGALLGKYCSFIFSNYLEVSNIYGFFPNVDWLTQNSKITKNNHKDAMGMPFYRPHNVLKKAEETKRYIHFSLIISCPA
jgi:hypothetical protein